MISERDNYLHHQYQNFLLIIYFHTITWFLEEIVFSRVSVFEIHQPSTATKNDLLFYYGNIQFLPCLILQTKYNNIQVKKIVDVVLEVRDKTEWYYWLVLLITSDHPILEVDLKGVTYICLDQSAQKNP